MRASSRLHVRLQLSALAANGVAFLALALLAPGVLLLEPEVATAALVESAWTYPLVLGLAALTTTWRLRRFGPVLRALEQGDADIASADAGFVRALHALPLSWLVQLTLQAISVAALTMIPQLRASLIDGDTQAAIVLLTATVTAATSLPLYVVARAMVGQEMQVVPWPTVEAAARDAEESRVGGLRRRSWGDPLGRVRGRLLFAVALPVALVGFGTALVAHAHVRAFETRERRGEAYALARGVLEVETFAGNRGRGAAIVAAQKLGFDVEVGPGDDAPVSGAIATPGEGGVRTLRTRLEDVTASVRFQPTTGGASNELYLLAAALFIAIAAAVGRAIGKSVSTDLVSATREVRLLGSQDVLRGVTRVAGPARFRAIAALGGGIEEVAERFREFARGRQRMIEARESAQRMRDLFLASMSHDLRSPLNGILGFVALLQKGTMTPAQDESLAIIDRRGRELLELIENILDAAKIEAGKLELSRDWTAPAELLAQVVRRGRELAGEKKGAQVDVVGELQPGVAPMFIDGPRLTQALINLVANAVRFVDRGAVRIRMAHAARASVEGAGHPSSMRPGVKIEVEDQGRGIAEKDLAQIFDAFRQPIRSRRHGGLGLGLSMTRTLVELHGGTIDVESSPERGSVFTMWIPLPSPGSVQGSVQSERQGERQSVPPFSRSTRGALHVPTPPAGTRPDFTFARSGAAAAKPRADDTQEFPTVQMPALEIPESPSSEQGEEPHTPSPAPRPAAGRAPTEDELDVAETLPLHQHLARRDK